uniref:Uncharacterized protein n=1 Tax=Megaselia scalaris TaxID=36166 RepID=T1GIV2_MEGSC
MKLTLFLLGLAALACVSAYEDNEEYDVLPFFPITEEEYAALRHLGRGSNVISERKLARSGFFGIQGFFDSIKNKNKPAKWGNNGDGNTNNGNNNNNNNNGGNKWGNKWGNKQGNNNGGNTSNKNGGNKGNKRRNKQPRNEIQLIRVPRQATNPNTPDFTNVKGISCIVIVNPKPTKMP